MSDEKPSLSYEELLALLQGSAALQARRSGERYSKDELIAAALELQVEPAVAAEHGTQTIPLLDGYSEQEQRWIESELQSWLLASNPTALQPAR